MEFPRSASLRFDHECAISRRQAQTRIDRYKKMLWGRRRSAASEGVLAALRLSKSAQSADKVHFSDSSGCRFFSPEIP
jgi:hypothetical protein